MNVHAIDLYPKDALDSMLASISFYRQVKVADEQQYNLLMRYSRMVEYRVGEVVIEAGQTDAWLFFLLKGRLSVYSGSSPMDIRRVNQISAGEVFGDLAVLMKHRRSATVIVDTSCKRALVFCTDFSVFGTIHDFSRINLATKLIFYRNMVHGLRWKLEVYRTQYPEYAKALSHHKIKLYSGVRDTVLELESLDDQAQQLANLLLEWNLEFTRTEEN